MLSPPSFILPMIVGRLILGGLWFHIKLDRDLFTWSTKPEGTLRTEEMKIIFERAKLLIMIIFPKGVKSLENQMLRHFFRATNFFSKLSFVEACESYEKETPRQTHFLGQFMLKRFVDCGLVFPNHNASFFDLFSSNPQHSLKASNFSKSLSTDFSSRTKHEVSSAYWDRLYSLPLKFIPVINLSFLIAFAKISTAITKSSPERGQPCLTPRSSSKNDVAQSLLRAQLWILL